MNKISKIIGVLLCIAGLILVRWFEDFLFYDPLLYFFKNDHTSQLLPEFDDLLLLGNLALRFLMNTALSLLILWFIFSEMEVVKISTFLYSALFLLLFLAFIYYLYNSNSENYLALFYVRRFLIQPIFLLLLVPAFYFQKKKASS